MSASARVKFLRISPFKVRRYTQLIQGQSIEQARALLRFQPSPTCRELLRLLDSAVANGENNLEMDPELMIVSHVQVDGGPSYKRIRPRARGRAYRILKRTSHVKIELDLRPELRIATARASEEEPAPRRRRRVGARKAGPAPAGGKEGPATAGKAAAKAKKGRKFRFRPERERKKPSAPSDRHRSATTRPMRKKGGE
ncbi:MAG: 50S ribosomal protein L22 [Planctomycetales bacterium 4484_113]|nr:MAG: 50S ribosomal protein L22 [Planctomycetales bacterium 4484_113]